MMPSSVSVEPVHDESVTPRPIRITTAHEWMDEEETENDSTDDSDQDLLKSDNQHNDEPQGFLKAKNASDAYFLAHGKSNPTSNNLLSERTDWKLPIEISDYLKSFNPQPLKSAQISWKQWTAELVEGYSLLFYGFGSKRVTLNEFVKRHLVESLGWEGLIVNGFQNGSDLPSILNDLEEICQSIGSEEDEEFKCSNQKKVNSLELMEIRARKLCNFLRNNSRKNSNLSNCVIMIHNLDGIGFRNSRIQTILSLLAAQPSIHLIASVDHIYAPILLPSHISSASPYVNDDSSSLKTLPSNYNFLYHHLPTDTPYTLESLLSGTISSLLPPSIFPPTMLGSQNSKSDIAQLGVTTAKATLHVLSSLTQKAKSLFRILADLQISQYQSLPSNEANKINETIKNPNHLEDRKAPRIAISSRKLFELARSEFVASVQSQMEALLVEFRDHAIVLASLSPPEDLITSNSNHDRTFEDDDEWFWISLSQKDLEHVLSKMDDL